MKINGNHLIKLVLIGGIMAGAWVGKVTIEWAVGSIVVIMLLF